MPNWLPWALLSAFFAALTAVLAKVGVSNINSDVATFVRTLVIAVFLATLLAARGLLPATLEVQAANLGFLVLSGLATGASWLCYFRALQLGDAAQVGPFEKLSVVLIAVSGVLFLGEKLSLLNWSGVALIASGAVLVAWR